MLAIMIVPAAAAARAVSHSPAGSASRWKAVGASTTGIVMSVPSRLTARSRFTGPRSTLGSSRRRANADSFARNVTSSSAPPATKS
jgi:hypothetical protein